MSADATAARVAIVTDSTADLDLDDAREREIAIVPLFVNFGDARFRDNVDLTRDEFYRKLGSLTELPTTSQPTPAMFEDVFRPLVEAGRPIVCVTIMASVSGTVNAATTAARAFPDADIRVIAGASVSGGLALAVQHAADLAAAGADADTIVAALAHDADVGRGYATVPDLSHAVRTGRVSRAQAFIGSLVKILPVLRLDSGTISEEARVRTYARAIDTMVEAGAAQANRADGARVCVVHAHAAPEAQRVAAALRARITTTPILFEQLEAGPVIGTHAGPGAVGIFVIPGP
jgi:DegV family protein with EDD domain